MEREEPAPGWTAVNLSCASCNTQWEDWQPVRVRLNVWLTCMEALRCPTCQAGPRYLRILTG